MTEPLDLDALKEGLSEGRGVLHNRRYVGALTDMEFRVLKCALDAGDALLGEVRKMRREPKMGALEATLRGLACQCGMDAEGHEASEHLSPGEREVFEQAKQAEAEVRRLRAGTEKCYRCGREGCYGVCAAPARQAERSGTQQAGGGASDVASERPDFTTYYGLPEAPASLTQEPSDAQVRAAQNAPDCESADCTGFCFVCVRNMLIAARRAGERDSDSAEGQRGVSQPNLGLRATVEAIPVASPSASSVPSPVVPEPWYVEDTNTDPEDGPVWGVFRNGLGSIRVTACSYMASREQCEVVARALNEYESRRVAVVPEPSEALRAAAERLKELRDDDFLSATEGARPHTNAEWAAAWGALDAALAAPAPEKSSGPLSADGNDGPYPPASLPTAGEREMAPGYNAMREANERLQLLDDVAYDREGVKLLTPEILKQWLAERRGYWKVGE